MQQSLIVHGALAVVAAGAAYVAWTQPTSSRSDDGKVVVVPGSPERLTSIQWREERWDVTVQRDQEDVEVKVLRLKTPAQIAAEKADAEKTDAEKTDAEKTDAQKTDVQKADVEKPKPPKPPPPDLDAPPVVDDTVPPKHFPGSKQAKEIFAKLAPLTAARSLGRPEPSKISALGLDAPKGKLTLVFGETRHTLEVGDSTYGSGDMYVQDVKGDVYLVPSSTLSSIRHGASTLLDRNAVGVEREAIERLAVTVGPGGREILQRERDDKKKAFWADPAEPDTKLELVGNWLARVLRLRVIDMSEETPIGMPAVEIEMFAGKDSLGIFKLWPPDDKHALATSTRFDRPFSVSKASADAIIKDVENVLQEGR